MCERDSTDDIRRGNKLSRLRFIARVGESEMGTSLN
jgi:hypothetical protein